MQTLNFIKFFCFGLFCPNLSLLLCRINNINKFNKMKTLLKTVKNDEITISTYKVNEIVNWNNKLFKILSINFDGKCNIKQITTTRRIGKIFTEIDLLELKKLD